MEIARTPTSPTWFAAFLAHAREHSAAAMGLGVAALAVLALLAQSLVQVIAGEAAVVVRYALLGGAAGFAATALGAVPALFLRGIPQRVEDSMLGMAAGMMLAVALALRGASGLLEPVGALLGAGLASGLAVAYPIGLGLAAGAMIFVVSHEVIPETHRNGHQTPATIGLMAGFALMMALDTALR